MATILIKKYGNRRLYDTSESRYVTLDEVWSSIRAGNDIRVLDAATNEDLTQQTLVQVVLEAGNAGKFLPAQLLVQMIRLSDDALAEFFSRYVTSALDVYLQAKRGVQSLAAYNPLTQIPLATGDALARMWMASPFATQPHSSGPVTTGYVPSPVVTPPPPPEDNDVYPDLDDRKPGVDEDVAAMRRELDELKQALRDRVGGRRAKKRKS